MPRRILAFLTTLLAAAALAAPPAFAQDPDLGGLPNGPDRAYGTPTPAVGKACPFVGKVPVKVPTVASPAGTSLRGLGGLNSSAGSVDSFVHGELCMSVESLAQAKAGHPPAVLVLVHGITYGTWYWDLPYKPGTYSTVNYLNKHGYATLNIDRIGDGRSGHPSSAIVNAPSTRRSCTSRSQNSERGRSAARRSTTSASSGTVTAP
jgi:hypothetical protein